MYSERHIQTFKCLILWSAIQQGKSINCWCFAAWSLVCSDPNILWWGEGTTFLEVPVWHNQDAVQEMSLGTLICPPAGSDSVGRVEEFPLHLSHSLWELQKPVTSHNLHWPPILMFPLLQIRLLFSLATALQNYSSQSLYEENLDLPVAPHHSTTQYSLHFRRVIEANKDIPAVTFTNCKGWQCLAASPHGNLWAQVCLPGAVQSSAWQADSLESRGERNKASYDTRGLSYSLWSCA